MNNVANFKLYKAKQITDKKFNDMYAVFVTEQFILNDGVQSAFNTASNCKAAIESEMGHSPVGAEALLDFLSSQSKVLGELVSMLNLKTLGCSITSYLMDEKHLANDPDKAIDKPTFSFFIELGNDVNPGKQSPVTLSYYKIYNEKAEKPEDINHLWYSGQLRLSCPAKPEQAVVPIPLLDNVVNYLYHKHLGSNAAMSFHSEDNGTHSYGFANVEKDGVYVWKLTLNEDYYHIF